MTTLKQLDELNRETEKALIDGHSARDGLLDEHNAIPHLLRLMKDVIDRLTVEGHKAEGDCVCWQCQMLARLAGGIEDRT